MSKILFRMSSVKL